MIYLDNAATSPLLPVAAEAMRNCPFGNASSAHVVGRDAYYALEIARRTIADCIGCEPSEVYFTSGATEACSIMSETMRHIRDIKPACASDVEHSAMRLPFYPDYAPDAHILANNETGKIYDLKDLPEKCGYYKKPHILGTDATAAVGHIPVNFKDLGVDYMAFGGHKFGGPMGIGGYIEKTGAYTDPHCWVHQERGIRPGTVSVPLAVGMAAALKWRTENWLAADVVLVARDDMISRLNSMDGVHVNFDYSVGDWLPGTISVRFDGIDAQTMVMALSDKGVCVSAGSACDSHSTKPSRVLLASRLTKEQALSTIRISIDIQNTKAEIEEASKIIEQTVKELRSA